MARGRFRFRKAISGSAALRVRLWTPRLIGSSLLAWYDAAEVGSFSFGTGVSQWRDLSGNGLHLDQSIGANQPIRDATGLNGFPTVAFDGADDTLRSDPAQRPWPAPLVQPFTLISVLKPPAYASVVSARRMYSQFNRNFGGTNATHVYDYYAFAGSGNPVGIVAFAPNGFGGEYRVYNASGVPYHPSATVISALVVNGIGNSHRRFYGDPVDYAVSAQTSNLYGLCLGADGLGGSPSLWSATSFSEFMVVTGTPNTALLERIEGYLAWKWGVQGSLVAGHPYLNAPPTP